MKKKAIKYYVVWIGREPGIYTDWEKCKQQVTNFDGAKFMAFPNMAIAELAYKQGHEKFISNEKKQEILQIEIPEHIGKPKKSSIAVDAACSGNPGLLEYRGVYVKDGKEIFRMGPYEDGTNNIGEFLAIVHGLALLKQKNLDLPIYSDSQTAINWVINKKAKTKLEPTDNNQELFELISRAEKWLLENYSNNHTILKWQTQYWGEIPADFGRK